MKQVKREFKDGFQREMFLFLCLLVVGAMLYQGFGEWATDLGTERKLELNRPGMPQTENPDEWGLDYYIISKIHFYSLFVGALGAVGLLCYLRMAKLIK